MNLRSLAKQKRIVAKVDALMALADPFEQQLDDSRALPAPSPAATAPLLSEAIIWLKRNHCSICEYVGLTPNGRF